jgi:hypothetical protein
MSAHQIAEIAPFIREAFEYARRHPAAKKDLCATYDVVGVEGAWAQVTSSKEMNVAYPRENSPERELGHVIKHLSGAKLISWEERKYATWSFTSANATEVAKVLDQVLAYLFNLGDYSVDAQLEQL